HHRKLHHDCGSFVANEKTVVMKEGCPHTYSHLPTTHSHKGGHYRTDLHAIWGLPDPRPRPKRHNGISHRQIWTDATRLSKGVSSGHLQHIAAHGKTLSPFGGD